MSTENASSSTYAEARRTWVGSSYVRKLPTLAISGAELARLFNSVELSEEDDPEELVLYDDGTIGLYRSLSMQGTESEYVIGLRIEGNFYYRRLPASKVLAHMQHAHPLFQDANIPVIQKTLQE